MKTLLFFLLSPLFLFSQVQIGNDIDGVAAGDQSGIVSFSSDGTIVAIGGPGNDDAGEDAGHVRVFENISGVWTQIGDDINGDAAFDTFGTSVSISSDGRKVAIGSPGNDTGGVNAGHVRVFENISGTWTQIGNAINGSVGDSFGYNVILSDNGLKIAIGAPEGDFVRVFEYISGTWSQVGSDIVQITEIYYDIAFSGDGSTVSIYSNNTTQQQGTMRVFRLVSGNWLEIGEFSTNGIFSYSSLSFDGSVIAITSSHNYGTKIYKNMSNTWTQIGNTIGSNAMGIDLSSNGSILAVIDNSTSPRLVLIYKNIDNLWIKIGNNIFPEGTPAETSFTNLSISHDGSILAAGHPVNNDNGHNSGSVRVYDLSALLSVDKPNLGSAKLYPNPAQNEFTLELPLSQTLEKVNIYNNLGQFIQTSQKNIINTSQFAPGLYFVEIATNQGKATKKLIIK